MKPITILLIAGILLIVSCASPHPVITPQGRLGPSLPPSPTLTRPALQTLTPTLTALPSFTPTFTPTLTSTPQPPLTDHEWYPEPVLISMREIFGDGGTAIGDTGSTWFILYADGSLFVPREIVSNDTYQRQILTKKLDRKGICQHLNTLDQIGYLDYDASDYSFIGGSPSTIGGGDLLIQVNAWKLKDDSYYGLPFYLHQDVIDDLYGQDGYPIISPALRNTYYFLYQYPETGLEIYKPDRLAVWIVPGYLSPDLQSTAQTWQLSAPSLQMLLEKSHIYMEGADEIFIELRGGEAKAVYAYLGETDLVHTFVQDLPDGTRQYFTLQARPLLPFEELRGDGMSEIVPSGSEKPDSKLSCYPSDGILPIPTP